MGIVRTAFLILLTLCASLSYAQASNMGDITDIHEKEFRTKKIPLVQKLIENKINESEANIEKRIAEEESARKRDIDNVRLLVTQSSNQLGEARAAIDRWLSFLTIFIAIVGLALPFVSTWTLKKQYQRAVVDAEHSAKEAEHFSREAANLIEKIKRHGDKAEEMSVGLEKNREIIEKAMSELGESDGLSDQESEAIRSVAESESAPVSERLIALGLQSFQNKEWIKAIGLLQSAIEIDSENIIASVALSLAIRKHCKVLSKDVSLDILYKEIQRLTPIVKSVDEVETLKDKLMLVASHSQIANVITELNDYSSDMTGMLEESFDYIKLIENDVFKEGTSKRVNVWKAVYAMILYDLTRSSSGAKNKKYVSMFEKFMQDNLDNIELRGAFNLSCYYAINGDIEKAKEMLLYAEKIKAMPDCDKLKMDEDLDSLREFDWFKELLERVCN